MVRYIPIVALCRPALYKQGRNFHQPGLGSRVRPGLGSWGLQTRQRHGLQVTSLALCYKNPNILLRLWFLSVWYPLGQSNFVWINEHLLKNNFNAKKPSIHARNQRDRVSIWTGQPTSVSSHPSASTLSSDWDVRMYAGTNQCPVIRDPIYQSQAVHWLARPQIINI